ncbi:MAG: recombination protein RecR [Phycisphaerales bacterium]|nr:recombination protein RecR [Phycisphaerales bacterium]
MAAQSTSPANDDTSVPKPSQYSSVYPESVQRLMTEFAHLPGIGNRTAERLAFFILKSDTAAALRLADAVRDVKTQVKHCEICLNLTESSPCPICSDPRRDAGLVLVVEQPKDVISLEQTGMHRGVYHILMGHLAPLEGVTPGDLAIDELMHRIADPSANAQQQPVHEIILGLNPNMEGDGTALYLAEEAAKRQPDITISRLARGLPSGSQLEYASKAVLADAIMGRQPMG